MGGMKEENQINEDRIVKIAEGSLPSLDKAIEKLNRRADKIGCPHVSYTVHRSFTAPSPYHVKRLERQAFELSLPITQETIDALPKIKMNEVEILGEGPKIEGYKFIGTLDHYTLPGKVIVQSVPGETVPTQFFDSEAICNHCDKIRNRVETFIVESDDGEYLQVGRNCLKDFFGHDPMAIARFLTRVMKFCSDLEDEDKWGGRGQRSGDWMYLDSVKVLTNTAAVIRTYGWVPRSAASPEEGRTATADRVSYIMTPSWSRDALEAKQKFIATLKFDEAKDNEEALNAALWLTEQEDNPGNSYMHNLKLLADVDMVPIKMLGYWCSLVSTFQRAQERLERAKATLKLNEYYGTEGERIEVEVTCVGVRYIDGRYGPVTIHRMLTAEGHTLMWFANTGSKMDTGHRYLIRGRIKGHDEYKDWKQTKLTRVSVREELEAEKEAA